MIPVRSAGQSAPKDTTGRGALHFCPSRVRKCCPCSGLRSELYKVTAFLTHLLLTRPYLLHMSSYYSHISKDVLSRGYNPRAGSSGTNLYHQFPDVPRPDDRHSSRSQHPPGTIHGYYPLNPFAHPVIQDPRFSAAPEMPPEHLCNPHVSRQYKPGRGLTSGRPEAPGMSMRKMEPELQPRSRSPPSGRNTSYAPRTRTSSLDDEFRTLSRAAKRIGQSRKNESSSGISRAFPMPSSSRRFTYSHCDTEGICAGYSTRNPCGKRTHYYRVFWKGKPTDENPNGSEYDGAEVLCPRCCYTLAYPWLGKEYDEDNFDSTLHAWNRLRAAGRFDKYFEGG